MSEEKEPQDKDVKEQEKPASKAAEAKKAPDTPKPRIKTVEQDTPVSIYGGSLFVLEAGKPITDQFLITTLEQTNVALVDYKGKV